MPETVTEARPRGFKSFFHRLRPAGGFNSEIDALAAVEFEYRGDGIGSHGAPCLVCQLVCLVLPANTQSDIGWAPTGGEQTR